MLFLWTWSLLCLCFFPRNVYAGTVDVQDDDPGVIYQGFWLPDASPNAHGGHETWTNQSGATVYYDFQGARDRCIIMKCRAT